MTGLSAAARAWAGAAVSEGLAASIGKVGLSGLARGGGGSGPGVPVLIGSAAAVGVVVLGLVSASVLRSSSGSAGGVPAGVVAGAVVGANGAAQVRAVARGPARPTKAIGPFQVVTATDERFEDRGLWLTEQGMSIRMGTARGRAPADESDGAVDHTDGGRPGDV